ncbi:MAG: hypothetical protein M1836_006783 [Candelina mexicana]|nr:MAG: hypothetical protein M1836_006783 [Candelina mexicana]
MPRITRSGKSAGPAPAPDAARTGVHVKSFDGRMLIIVGLKPGMITTKERSESALSSPPGSPKLSPPVAAPLTKRRRVSQEEAVARWGPAMDPEQRHLSERACPKCGDAFDDAFIMEFRDHVEACVGDGADAEDDLGPAPPRDETEGVDTEAPLTLGELAKLAELTPYTTGPVTPNEDPEIPDVFRAINDPQKFLMALANPQKQSTSALYANTKAACEALVAWQDEFLALDPELIRTGVNPPRTEKIPRNPRVVVEKERWEDMKESILYGYKYNKTAEMIGMQDPKAQGAGKARIGRLASGRSSRIQPNAKGESSKAGQGAQADTKGKGATSTTVVKFSTRQRKPTQKFEGTAQPESRASTAAPPVLSAVARGKKRAREDDTAEEPEAPPKKKLGRPPKQQKSTAPRQESAKPTGSRATTEPPPTEAEPTRPDDDELAAAKEDETPAPPAAAAPPARRPRGRPPKNAPKVAAPAKATKATKTDKTAAAAKPARSTTTKAASTATTGKQTPAIKAELPPVSLPTPAAPSTTAPTAVAASGPTRAVKGKVKSEKRSTSMKSWWAERRRLGTHRKKKNTDAAAAPAAVAAGDEMEEGGEEVEEEEVVVAKKPAPRKRKAAAVEEEVEEPSRAVGGVKRLKLTPPKPPSADGEEGGEKVAKRPKRAVKGRKKVVEEVEEEEEEEL